MENENVILTFDFSFPGNHIRRPFGSKYLLCQNEKGLFFVASSYCEEHKDLFEKFNDYIVNVYKAKVIGGGSMYYYGKEKGFVLTGYSIRYGRADHWETKKLIEKDFPGIPIAIEKN